MDRPAGALIVALQALIQALHVSVHLTVFPQIWLHPDQASSIPVGKMSSSWARLLVLYYGLPLAEPVQGGTCGQTAAGQK